MATVLDQTRSRRATTVLRDTDSSRHAGTWGAVVLLVLLVVGAALRARLGVPVAPDGSIDVPSWGGEAVLLGAVILMGLLTSPAAVALSRTALGRIGFAFGGLGAVALPGTGFGQVSDNGARIGFEIAGHAFQTSHLGLLGLTLFAASYLAAVPESNDDRTELANLAPLLLVIGTAAGLLVLMQDLGPLLVLGVVLLLLCVTLSKRLGPVIAISAAFAIGAAIAVLVSTEARGRAIGWLRDANDQVGLGLAVVRDAGWTGSGWARGWPRQVPVVDQDLPLIGVAADHGIPGVVLVLAAWAALIIVLCVRASQSFGPARAFGTAIAMLFTAQVVVHASMTAHLLPHSGLVLPLVSRGHSSLLVHAVAIGLGLGVTRSACKLPTRRANVVLPGLLAVALLALTVLRFVAVVHAPDDGPRDERLASLRELERGPILDRHGQVLSATTYRTSGVPVRTLYEPSVISLVGFLDARTFGRGLEASGRQHLTCAPASGVIDRFLGRCDYGPTHTTIDADATRAARAVVDRFADAGGSASIIVTDVDGRIELSAASSDIRTPDETFEGGSGEGWVPEVFTDARQPGSVIKPFVYLALPDPAAFTAPWADAITLPDGSTVSAWQTAGCDGDVAGAIRDSCNPAVIVAMRTAGHDAVSDVFARAGFDAEERWPGIEHLATSASGTTSSDPSLRELAAIGGGNANVTVAGMARATTGLAREDGRIAGGLTVLSDHVPPSTSFAEPSSIEVIVDGMLACPAEGTCPPSLAGAAAKTGTATPDGEAGSIGWCIGFTTEDDIGQRRVFASRIIPAAGTNSSGRQACELAAETLASNG